MNLFIFRQNMLLNESDGSVEHDSPFLVVQMQHHVHVRVLAPCRELVLYHPVSLSSAVSLHDLPGPHRREGEGGQPQGHVQGVDELVNLINLFQMVGVKFSKWQ